MSNLSKTQIDKLGDRLREGAYTDSDLELLSDYRQSFGEAHETVVQVIRKELQLEPASRPKKTTGAIVAKLRRGNIKLSQIQDIAGCRLVVADLAEQDKVVASLRALFPDVKVVDRRVKPSYGYRAVHLIHQISGKRLEIQVRTMLQHLWAQLSETLSSVFDPSLKYGGGDDIYQTLLSELSKLVITVEEAEAHIIRRIQDATGYGLATLVVTDTQLALMKIREEVMYAKGEVAGILKGVIFMLKHFWTTQREQEQ